MVTMEIRWIMGAEEEDRRMKDIKNELTNRKLARVCLPAMYAFNPDLQFTAEVPEDSGLPTWPIGETEEQKPEEIKVYRLNHSYFETEMRTQYVIINSSRKSNHSFCIIPANVLVRRLSNMNIEETSHEEKE